MFDRGPVCGLQREICFFKQESIPSKKLHFTSRIKKKSLTPLLQWRKPLRFRREIHLVMSRKSRMGNTAVCRHVPTRQMFLFSGRDACVQFLPCGISGSRSCFLLDDVLYLHTPSRRAAILTRSRLIWVHTVIIFQHPCFSCSVPCA